MAGKVDCMSLWPRQPTATLSATEGGEHEIAPAARFVARAVAEFRFKLELNATEMVREE